jgi:multiple sugar transport system substrate-binding protein
MIKRTGLTRRDFLRTTGLGIGGALFANALPGLVTAAQGNGITFWTHPYGDTVQWTSFINELLGEFTAETGIPVNSEVLSWDNAGQTWLLVASGGEHPDAADMWWLYSNAAIGGGQFGPMPLTQYKDEYFPDLEERFIEAALQDVYWNGDFYGIPWRGDIRPLIYRTDIFAEYGITAPPDTWDELVDYAKEMTVRDAAGNVERWGFAFGTARPLTALFPYYWAAGGEFMTEDGKTATIDNDAMRETLQWMYDLIWTHQVVDPNFMEEGYDPAAEFQNGRLAMNGGVSDSYGQDLTRSYPELEGKWMMAVPPMGPERRVAFSGAGYWGLLRGTERVEESLRLVQFLARDENMLKFAERTARVSANKAVMNADFWQDAEWKRVIVESLNYAHTSQHAAPAWSIISAQTRGSVLHDLYYDTLVLQQDIDEVVSRAQGQMQELMDQSAL